MGTATEKITATKVTRMTDVRIEIEPTLCPFNFISYELLAQRYRDWLDEFKTFLQDHRSQDELLLRVVADSEEVCSACNSPWEIDHENGECAHCGAAVARSELDKPYLEAAARLDAK